MTDRPGSPELHPSVTHWLRTLLHRHTGVVVGPRQGSLFRVRLWSHVAKHHDGDFEAFCAAVAAGDRTSVTRLVDLCTTHHTSFFREEHHFRHLRSVATDLASRAGTRPIAVWSAASSTGEEGYSALMTLFETVDEVRHPRPRLFGTDVSKTTVDLARRAIYDGRAVLGVPRDRLRRWFQQGTGKRENRYRLKAPLREAARFDVCNLLKPWSFSHDFDVVFCRNVLIYFDEFERRTLVNRIASRVRPGGYLYLGHSEGQLGRLDFLDLVGPSTFRRKEP